MSLRTALYSCFFIPVLALILSGELIAQAGKSGFYLFDQTNGLNRSRINEIERDNSGFYWLATEKGLVRFDGRNFNHLHESDNDPVAIEIKHLVLFENKLFSVAKNGSCFETDVKRCTTRQLHAGSVTDVAQWNDSAYYVLFSDGHLERHSKTGKVRSKVLGRGGKGNLIFFNHELLVSLQFQGVFSVNPSTLEIIRKYPIENDGFEESFDIEFGRLFFTSGYQAYEFKSNLGFQKIQIDSLIGGKGASVYEFTGNNSAYVVFKRKSLFRVENGNAILVEPGSDVDFELHNVYFDPPDNILVGTNQGLLYLVRSGSGILNFSDRGLEGDGPLRVRRKIVQEPNGHVLLVGSEYVYHYDEHQSLSRFSEVKLTGYDALIDDGNLIVTTEGQGVKRFDLNNIKASDFKFDLEGKNFFYSVIKHYNNRDLVLGGVGEVVVFNTATLKSKVIPVGYRKSIVKSLFSDSVRKSLLVGTETGLFVLDSMYQADPSYKQVEQQLKDDHIGDLRKRKGTEEFWIATGRGIAVLSQDPKPALRFLSHSNFINPRTVALLEDHSGRVWASTYNGIIGIDPKRNDFIRLTRKNGLLNSEFNYKAAAVLNDGRLMFGGLNGYDIIDPAKFEFKPNNRKGYVNAVYRISPTDTSFAPVYRGDRLEFEFNQSIEYLRVCLSSTDISAASKWSFEYRIDRGPWIALKSAFVDFFNMSHNSSLVEFRAFDQFGRVIEYEPVTINLYVPFYSNPLFIWSLGLLSFLMLVTIIVLSAQRFRREQLLKERITMDLHDEVGTILTRALYMAQDIEPPDVRHRLSRSLNSALYSLRVFIYSLSKRSLTIQGLYDEIADLVNQSFSNTDMRLSLHLSKDGEYDINPELYRDLKLVFYEIIGNMIRHSGASELTINFSVSLWNLHIEVTDNGKMTEIPDPNDVGGNGLKNIRRRVLRQHGTLDVSIPSAGHGLKYIINIKIK